MDDLEMGHNNLLERQPTPPDRIRAARERKGAEK
jgi:hypothetical protein